MSLEELKECEYIRWQMCFVSFSEFVVNARAIKKMYKELKNPIFYRWYVHSHNFSIRKKEAIWDYLNDDLTFNELKIK